MKKILLIIILVIVTFAFVACNSPTPPGTSWADKEILVYDVLDTESGEVVGTLTSTLERNPDDKTIDGNKYNEATSRLTLEYADNLDEETMSVSSLLNDFSPLATYKQVNLENKDYTLSSYYEEKYYFYTLTEDGQETSDRIKIKPEFIDNDLLYTYLRCQNLDEGINKAINIPDPVSGTLQSFSLRKTGTDQIEVPYPDGAKTAPCYEVRISRTTTPIGGSIFVYFSPAEDEYIVPGGLNSINDSLKMPVKIVENNYTYKLKSITVV